MSSVAGSSSSGPCLPEAPCADIPSPPRLRRLTGVPGHEPHRVNDLLVLRPAEGPAGRSSDAEAAGESGAHVVFFHGDIQSFQEEMVVDPEGVRWQSWSLERVALVLGGRFPGRHVWVVRASRMHLHKFSGFHNFVESNLFGAPEHSPDHGAFRHLRALLSHGMALAGTPNPLPPPGGAHAAATALPPGFSLTLVGFSKGCVVLNQLVYELAGARRDPHLAPFVGRVSDMFWLDGGHPGGGGTWVTERRALEELAASGVGVHAHVTPYEVSDPLRAWVGREHGRFVTTLEELGARLSSRMHFGDEPASIENHFRVIQDF